jgi:hypothetical protein
MAGRHYFRRLHHHLQAELVLVEVQVLGYLLLRQFSFVLPPNYFGKKYQLLI